MPNREYHIDFESWEDVMRSFDLHPSDQLEEPPFVFAEYDYSNWEGQAEVVYSYNGIIFYYVSGSHCSCFGLEEQWDPEEYDIEAIRAFAKGSLLDWLNAF